jgi:tRNA (guanine-N7-)-methyltransferase
LTRVAGDRSGPAPAQERRLYGRRRGRKLRPGRQRLLEDLLPRLRVPVPADGSSLDPRTLFKREPAEVWLEVGFGGGEHLAAQAAAHPNVGFIGAEPFVNGVAGLLARVARDGLDNVRVLDGDARPLVAALAEASIGRVFVLFSDPWPKPRHHRRRFIGPATLDDLARAMRDGAELRFASDHMGYVRWTLEHATRHPCFRWTARSRRDWRRRPDDGFATRYEAKAVGRGAACVYLTFARRPRGNDGAPGSRDCVER